MMLGKMEKAPDEPRAFVQKFCCLSAAAFITASYVASRGFDNLCLQ